MIRRTLAGVALVGFVAVALGLAARPTGQPSSPAARTHRIARELRCPVCQGLSVADSPSIPAGDIRADIRRRVDAGQTDGEIRAAYVQRYGEWILLRPQGRGFASGLWLLPAMAVTAAAAGLVLALRRWHRQPALAASPEDRALVDALRARPTPGPYP